MKQIETANYIFAALQAIWLILFFVGRIWSFVGTGDDSDGRFIRAEVGAFFFHAGTVLAVWAAAYDHVSKLRWRFLIPLFMVQLANGIFTVLNVGLYSANRPMMHPLYEFVLYGIGVYQLSILLVGTIYYSYHAWDVSQRKEITSFADEIHILTPPSFGNRRGKKH